MVAREHHYSVRGVAIGHAGTVACSPANNLCSSAVFERVHVLGVFVMSKRSKSSSPCLADAVCDGDKAQCPDKLPDREGKSCPW
jgi:hypothetical protein